MSLSKPVTMRPLDHYDNLIKRCGRITSCLSTDNKRLYMPELMAVLNDLSTRQLKIKAGHAHLTHLRTALRHPDAMTQIALNKDLTMWELHGKKFDEQYITSVASSSPGSGGAAVKSAIIANIEETAPAPVVKPPSHCSQMAAKQIEKDQAIIADLTSQLKKATLQANDGFKAQTKLDMMEEEMADLKRRFDELIAADAQKEQNKQVIVAEFCSILTMIDKHACDHYTTAFSHKAEIFPPDFPIENAYNRIVEAGGLSYELDFCIRQVIKYIKPRMPRSMGMVTFYGEPHSEYSTYETQVRIYRTVCCPETETPYRKVTPFVKRNVWQSREHIYAFIAEHAPPFLEEAKRICEGFCFA